MSTAPVITNCTLGAMTYAGPSIQLQGMFSYFTVVRSPGGMFRVSASALTPTAYPSAGIPGSWTWTDTNVAAATTYTYTNFTPYIMNTAGATFVTTLVATTPALTAPTVSAFTPPLTSFTPNSGAIDVSFTYTAVTWNYVTILNQTSGVLTTLPSSVFAGGGSYTWLDPSNGSLTSGTSYGYTVTPYLGKTAGTATTVSATTLVYTAPTITAFTPNSTSVDISFVYAAGSVTWAYAKVYNQTSRFTATIPGTLFTGTGYTWLDPSNGGLVSGTTYAYTVTPYTANHTPGTSVTVSASPVLLLNGSTAAQANTSASAIKTLTGTNTNGVYWINLPTAGATQVYCIMDSAVDGGGWMMAMKATRGTTFQYYANYWTTTNTLNPTDTTRNDADAKFDTMNYFPATDILGLWSDISSSGGSLSLGVPYTCWCWEQKGFNTYNGNSGTTTLVNFFTNVSRYFIQDAKTWKGWNNGSTNNPIVFSSQSDVRFYGFNYYNDQAANTGTRSRWGFGWNENGGGLYPNGDMTSDDVWGGIGTNGCQQATTSTYSAGDGVGCCADNTGINRSARVEVYIR